MSGQDTWHPVVVDEIYCEGVVDVVLLSDGATITGPMLDDLILRGDSLLHYYWQLGDA